MEARFASAVFLDPVDAYCSARARETGAGLPATRIAVESSQPTVRAITDGGRTFLSKNMLGRIAAARLALQLADAEPHHVELPHEPVVSVVVPYYERTEYLPCCLEALARQTYAPLEVLVADGGSASDAARSQLADMEKRSWPWMLRVVRTSDAEPAISRNAGWAAARGELVAFIDDDDVAFDDMLERLWRARAASGVDVAVGGARFFHGDGDPVEQPGDLVRIPLCDPHELGLISNQYGGPVALWPRQLLDQLEGFTPSPVEDWLLLARAAQRGVRLTAPPDPVHWYRQTTSGRHSPDPVKMRDSGVPQLAAAFAERLPEDLRLLPLIAAGAYAELERRARPKPTRLQALRSLARRVARR